MKAHRGQCPLQQPAEGFQIGPDGTPLRPDGTPFDPNLDPFENGVSSPIDPNEAPLDAGINGVPPPIDGGVPPPIGSPFAVSTEGTPDCPEPGNIISIILKIYH